MAATFVAGAWSAGAAAVGAVAGATCGSDGSGVCVAAPGKCTSELWFRGVLAPGNGVAPCICAGRFSSECKTTLGNTLIRFCIACPGGVGCVVPGAASVEATTGTAEFTGGEKSAGAPILVTVLSTTATSEETESGPVGGAAPPVLALPIIGRICLSESMTGALEDAFGGGKYVMELAGAFACGIGARACAGGCAAWNETGGPATAPEETAAMG